jgi:ornithine decarboxylase
MILKLLLYLGAGFDCASKSEIEQILEMGVSPEKIIFANPCKEDNYIKYAHESGIKLMTFDNEEELLKIKANHSNAEVLLRIKTDDSKAKWGLSCKFGADTKSSHQLIELAKKLDMNLVDIAFHMGGSNVDPNFRGEIKKARELFDFARDFYGFEMYILDIGGGFPGFESEDELFKKMASEISRDLDDFFPLDLLEKLNKKKYEAYNNGRTL